MTISRREVVINVCAGGGDCEFTAVLPSLRAGRVMVESAQPVDDPDHLHTFQAQSRMSIRRDVLILRALWTVGRYGDRIEASAYIMADLLAWTPDQTASITEIPLYLRADDGLSLTDTGVRVARAVALMMMVDYPRDSGAYQIWHRIADYLER